jgi:hypothetical protein
MVESQWRDLYKAAMLELDPKQLQARVKAAEGGGWKLNRGVMLFARTR